MATSIIKSLNNYPLVTDDFVFTPANNVTIHGQKSVRFGRLVWFEVNFSSTVGMTQYFMIMTASKPMQSSFFVNVRNSSDHKETDFIAYSDRGYSNVYSYTYGNADTHYMLSGMVII